MLVFQSPMQPESIESHLTIDPPVKGHFQWNGAQSQSISFWPDGPMTPGKHYSIHLALGARSQQGLPMLGEQTWTVTVRSPAVLYLAPSRNSELWQVDSDGKNPIRLTSTNGGVYSYDVSLDGEQIIYSARNSQKGYDLWQVDRSGTTTSLLLPCGADWCIDPAIAPDGSRVAYSRRQFSGVPGGAPNTPRLWMLDRTTGSTKPMYVDPNTAGSSPAWSPDGRYLAFFDDPAQSVRVLDLSTKKDFSIAAGIGASFAWSADSRRIYFSSSQAGEEGPAVIVGVVDVQTQQPGTWLSEEGVDYTAPVFTPNGAWAVIARREVIGAPGKQLWLMRADTRDVQSITSDPLSNYGGVHWDPTGMRLVYQRLTLNDSGSQPEVGLWDRATGQLLSLAKDAYQPDWLP